MPRSTTNWVSPPSSSSSRKRSFASSGRWSSTPAGNAQYNRGNALSSLGRPEEAIEKFRAAAANMPDSPEIHYNLANALRDLGRLNDAVASYRQALRLRPDYLKAFNNLGNVLREQGKLAEALETYRAALAIKPDYAQGHHNLGVTLLAEKCPEEAIAEFRGPCGSTRTWLRHAPAWGRPSPNWAGSTRPCRCCNRPAAKAMDRQRTGPVSLKFLPFPGVS